tara:strand:+ start:308 stop:547 length:240 start_codon:yes stop_codon:yes gene_type:complete
MLYIGLVIGLLAGAVAMYLKTKKDLEVVNATLEVTQDKLKSVKSQLYKRRTSYKKKPNGSNGKKAVKKKTTANTKKTNI